MCLDPYLFYFQTSSGEQQEIIYAAIGSQAGDDAAVRLNSRGLRKVDESWNYLRAQQLP